MTSEASSTGTGSGAENVIDIHKLESQRRANREAVVGLGLAPYGVAISGREDIAAAKARFSQEAHDEQMARGKEPGFVDQRPRATIAGRVMLCRDNGKLIWMNLRDTTGDMQVAVSQSECEELGFKLAKATDLGDLIIATGTRDEDQDGRDHHLGESIRPGSKCLVPPPEKHAGSERRRDPLPPAVHGPVGQPGDDQRL
jgi:lysyl-tRNA synthetase class 2